MTSNVDYSKPSNPMHQIQATCCFILCLPLMGHLVVEVIKQPEHAVLIVRVSFVDVLQQLDFI